MPSLNSGILLRFTLFANGSCNDLFVFGPSLADNVDKVSLLLLLILRGCVPSICRHPLNADICQIYFDFTCGCVKIYFDLLLKK